MKNPSTHPTPRALLAVMLLLGTLRLTAALPEDTPHRPPPGLGKYILVLRETEPVPPGHANKPPKKIVEPDVRKHGGQVVKSRDNQRLIFLPPGQAKYLRADENVAYLQRLWIGEPLEEWNETETAAAARRVTTNAETNLTWKSGPYAYDGAGNIKSIGTETNGTDTFAYDRVHRLKTAVVNGVTESYRYDAFGNLLQTQLGTATPKVMGVDSHSNRLAHVEYDVAGNVRTSAPGTEYFYDSAGMMSGVVTSVGTRERMIYTADDERIAIYFDDDFSRWTIRNLDGKVLRTFAGSDWGWQWEQDYVYAGETLVGGEREAYYGGRRHFHLDHLGSVRVSTNENRLRLGRHDYYPFGVEQTQTVQEQVNFGYTTPPEKMKFTGHERDLHGYWNTENADYLDYMHARHYNPNRGRFLSVDPFLDTAIALKNPQGWNRYAYVRNNPINKTDPTGKCEDPKPNSGGTRICIQAFIPTKTFAGFVGDNRNAQSNGGTFRANQSIMFNKNDKATAPPLQPGTSRLAAAPSIARPAVVAESSVKQIAPGVVQARGADSDGLAFGLAPNLSYNLTIGVDKSGNAAVLGGKHSG